MLHGPDPGPCREVGALLGSGNPLRRSAERGSTILVGYDREGIGYRESAMASPQCRKN